MTALTLHTYTQNDIEHIWQLAYQHDLEWMKWNGPYFNDSIPSLEDYMKEAHIHYVNSEFTALIHYNGQTIGQVFAYWDDGSLKQWLETGICLYDSSYWNLGIGSHAMKQWISTLFDKVEYIPRIGFTTWSGNIGMIAIGDKLRMTQEAKIRQVRYYNGQYYDSIRYGVLRDEWIN